MLGDQLRKLRSIPLLAKYIMAKGDLFIGIGYNAYDVLTAPTDPTLTYVLVSDPTTPHGLRWMSSTDFCALCAGSGCTGNQLDFSQACNSAHLATVM